MSHHLKKIGLAVFLLLLALIPLARGGYFPFPTTLPSTSGSVLSSTTAGVTSWVSPLPLANGGTGQSAKTAAFDALQPMTTSGDIIVGGASGTGTRAACATANTVLRGGTPAACGSLVNADLPTTLSSKTIGDTNTVTLKANLFTLEDQTDTSKGVNFVLSSISPSTNRNITIPNTSSTMAVINIDNGFTHAQTTTGIGGNVAHGCRQVTTAGSASSSTASSVCNAAGEMAIGGGCLCSSASGLKNSYLVNSTTWGCDWNATCATSNAYAICCIF